MRIVNRVEWALADFAPRPHWGKLFTLDASTLAERYPRHADFLDLLDASTHARPSAAHGWTGSSRAPDPV